MLDFREEAAKSKVWHVSRRISELQKRGYRFATRLREQVAELEAGLRQSLGELEGESAARALDDVLAAAFWAGEEIELAKAPH